MTRLTIMPLVLLVSFAGAARAGDSSFGDLPRLELTSSGPLFAAKARPKAAASDDVLADGAGDTAAPAAGDDGEGESAPADDGTSLPDEEVKTGGTTLGESVGGATGFVFKQGIYTQSDLGGFFVLGAGVGMPSGYTIAEECNSRAPCKPVPTSQLQPYIGLSVGYDIFQWLGIQLSFGTGFVANAAVYNEGAENPRDYGLTTVNAAVVGSFYVLERLAIMGKLMGGLAVMSPEPAPDENTIGGNVGAGVGIRYATLLPDVFVGIDANFNLAIIPGTNLAGAIVPGISFAPVIKYVF